MSPLTLAFIPPGFEAPFRQEDPKCWNIATGWAFYAALMTVLMTTKRRPLFVRLYLVLVLALILNIAGCYKVAQDIGRDLH